MKKNKTILSFDLDFTLIDNKKGIINSFKYALKKYSLPELSTSEIEKTIGMPLNDVFTRFSGINPLILTTAFREYYSSEGIYQVKLIPGVKNKLKELRKSFILGVITSKKEELAVKLLKYLKIDNYFDYILGENENRKRKTDPKLKDYLLKKYLNCNIIVIGDHPKDRELAEMLNCPFIGVLTGFHNSKQLIPNDNSNMLILKSVNDITIDLINSLF
ncbi:MAG: HAD family hydrolase [Promethearchaeota archaeon]